eukprot:sb/3461138/
MITMIMIVFTMVTHPTIAPVIDLDRSFMMHYSDTSVERTCNTLLSTMTTLYTKNISEIKSPKFHCPFVPNSLYNCPGGNSSSKCLNKEWRCVLSRWSRCDGVSECLEDECGCANATVVFCPGPVKGCITFDRICNGVYDCPGGEDERACTGLERISGCKSSVSLGQVTVDIKLAALCSGAMLDALYCGNTFIKPCLKAQGQEVNDCVEMLVSFTGIVRGFSRLSHEYVAACKRSCDVSSEFCDMLVGYRENTLMEAFSYRCDNYAQITAGKACDGIIDCADKSDEKYCPGRFYCSKADVEWYGEDKVCDGYKDCKNGLDECSGCSRGPFSSDDKIIQNHVLFLLPFVIASVTFGANGYNFYMMYNEKPVKQSHLKVDRFLNYCLIAHDTAMGAYLSFLLGSSLWYNGRYCQFDTEWRTGPPLLLRACTGLERISGCKSSVSLGQVTVDIKLAALCSGAMLDALYCGNTFIKPCLKAQGQEVNDCVEMLVSFTGIVRGFSRLSHEYVAACKRSCDVSSEFCDMLVGYRENTLMEAFSYRCDNYAQITAGKACDGIIDTRLFSLLFITGPAKMTRKADVEWYGENKVCDGYKDCTNGLDECSGCSRGPFSSDDKIIQNHVLFLLPFVIASVTFGANGYNFYMMYNEKPVKQSHLKVDRFLNFCLIAHDTAMGAYLSFLLGSSLWYNGRYCQFDTEWRTGRLCEMMGVVFSVSCHGSLIIVLLMSITRAYKCVRSFSEGIPKHGVYIVTVLLMVLNVCHSAAPLLKVGLVQEIFRSQIRVPNTNPFMTDYKNSSNIDVIHKVFFPNTSTNSDWYQKILDLKTITSTPDIFDVQDFSIYSWSPVCLPDLFTAPSSTGPAIIYKVVYISIIGLILLLIGVSYACILSSLVKPVPGQESRVKEIGQKAAVIVGVKLVTWLFVAGIMVRAIVSKEIISATWYEVNVIVHFLNPYQFDDLKTTHDVINAILSGNRPNQEIPVPDWLITSNLNNEEGCVRSFSEGIPKHGVYIVTVLLMVLNVCHSAAPLLKVGLVQEIFRSQIRVPNTNPFMTDYKNSSNIDVIHKVFFPNTSTNSDWYQKIQDLKTITSTPDIFDVQDFSIYSWSPVCLPDLFNAPSSTGPAIIYKIIYISIIGLILLLIGVSYACILSSLVKPVPGQESRVKEIGQKAAVIVGVKLVTWLFVAGIMVRAIVSKEIISATWYEVTAISILPLNSCLNPVFHSDLYKKGKRMLTRKGFQTKGLNVTKCYAGAEWSTVLNKQYFILNRTDRVRKYWSLIG